jgi:murein DD-endopeptidase MepM/ murein hydrolase activator NlpD
VVAGEVIGVMGQSGRATGTHLHYSVRKNGKVVNPAPYLELYELYLKSKDALRASRINY